MTPKLSPLEESVLMAIRHRPGITQEELLADGWGNNQPPEDRRMYGRQRPVSWAIAKLRAKKLVSDVARRCEHCGRALTRGQKNVPLRAL